MMNARSLLLPIVFALMAVASVSAGAGAGTGLAEEWLGSYSGTVSFSQSFPPRDDFSPRDDSDDLLPDNVRIRTHIVIAEGATGPTIWLSVASGAMLTAKDGETLEFGPLAPDKPANLISAIGVPHLRHAHLLVANEKLMTEVIFEHASGGVWWRYVTLTRTTDGVSVLIWVFDRDGAGARGWSGNLPREK